MAEYKHNPTVREGFPSIRTYKRKLVLNAAQRNRIDSWIGACRVVYNLGMEVRNAHYSATGKGIHKYELMKQVTQVRKDVTWIEDVPADCLTKVIERLDFAYQRFFKGFKKGFGFPKFASKRTFKSIPFKQVSVNGNTCKLHKVGVLIMVKDSPIIGTPNTCCIIKEPTGYFICIECKNVLPKFSSENQTIGLDMGISHFCIDSNGQFIANPQHFKKYERQLRIQNKSLSRKRKGSNSWKKQVKRVSLLHHKVKNVRKDFLHKESTKIAKANSQVFMEKLNVIGMAKNAKLSKHILDAGWGTFRQMLSYKTEVILIDPKYTSQTCNECGAKDKRSRISQSEYCCTSCGHVSNADVNAAKNILSKGIALVREREPLGCA